MARLSAAIRTNSCRGPLLSKLTGLAGPLLKEARSWSCTAQPGAARLHAAPAPRLLEGVWKRRTSLLIAVANHTQHSTCEGAHFPESSKSNVNPVCAALCVTTDLPKHVTSARMCLQAFRHGSCAYPPASLFCKDGGAARVARTAFPTCLALIDRSYQPSIGKTHWLRAIYNVFFPRNRPLCGVAARCLGSEPRSQNGNPAAYRCRKET